MTPKLQRLFDALVTLGFSPKEDRGELTVVVKAAEYKDACTRLRDDPAAKFEQLVDLCGVDYGAYADKPWEGPRFAAVVHLLSVQHNGGCACARSARTTPSRCSPRSSRCGPG